MAQELRRATDSNSSGSPSNCGRTRIAVPHCFAPRRMFRATLSRRATLANRTLRELLADLPPWLSSTVFHLTALILLGLIQTALVQSRSAFVEVSRTDSTGAGD